MSAKNKMNKIELLQKIILKREFSQLPLEDVKLALSHFIKRNVSDEEKIKLTRELLHKVYGAFLSKKLLSPKNKDEEWILRKHLSTRERLPYYKNLYQRILPENESFVVFDLGAGINGFSVKYFKKDIDYIGIEAVGQLVDSTNNYFLKNNQKNKKIYHESLFNLSKIKEIISSIKKPKIVFLFKVLDSLEMLERGYSKKLLIEISSIVDKVVVSFATRSMLRREKFKANRNWIIKFINENFLVTDDFEIGGERYICFLKK